MKSFVAALPIVVFALMLSHPSQAAGPIMGIPGYYDPATSRFVPMYTPKVTPLTSVVRTGTVKVVVTLSIESSIGTDEAIVCNATISSDDASFFNSASDSGEIVRSGSTGTLTMSIPYSWTMAATGERANVTVSCDVENFNTGGISRSIDFIVPGFVVPVTAGTVTTESLSASM
jgi:hypothetical protein